MAVILPCMISDSMLAGATDSPNQNFSAARRICRSVLSGQRRKSNVLCRVVISFAGNRMGAIARSMDGRSMPRKGFCLRGSGKLNEGL
jgi:hypothetical protein